MARSGPFRRLLAEELHNPEFAQEYEAELQRLKGGEIMIFEGEIYKIILHDSEPREGGVHLKGDMSRAYSHLGLTDDEAKPFHVGQKVRVTVEVVEEGT